MRADPQSAKRLTTLLVFFALLRSARVKAARRMLVKLKPGQPLRVLNGLLTEFNF
jgi:hypothetical protein